MEAELLGVEMIVQQTAVLSPYQRDRLEKNILQLCHVRQNLVELGMERMAILVQRAIEAGEAA